MWTRLLGVWVRAQGREKRHVDLLGVSDPKVEFSILHYYDAVCLPHLEDKPCLSCYLTNFIIFRYLLCGSPFVTGTGMPGGALCQSCLKPRLLKTQKPALVLELGPIERG